MGQGLCLQKVIFMDEITSFYKQQKCLPLTIKLSFSLFLPNPPNVQTSIWSLSSMEFGR